MKKLLTALALAATFAVPALGRHADGHAVRTGHDLLHLPDHRQEGDFQGRRRQQN